MGTTVPGVATQTAGSVPLTVGPRLSLLAAWFCLAFGEATSQGGYSRGALLLVGLGTGLLIVAMTVRTAGFPPGALWVAFGVVMVLVVAGAVLHQSVFGSGWQLTVSRAVLGAGAVVGTLCVTVGAFAWRTHRTGPARALHLVVVLLVAIAGVLAVQASPRPFNDVWAMLQATSRGLWHGLDMYHQHWQAPTGEDARYYTYLPGTPVILAPFRALLGDVRYGYVAVLTISSFLVARLRATLTAPISGCLLLLAPLAVAAVEEAWNEPLVLAGAVAMIYLVSRGHPGWAAVCFGAALATKQYAWVMVPFAAWWGSFGFRRTLAAMVGAVAFMLPWAVAGWHAFLNDTVISLVNTSGATGSSGSAALYLRDSNLSLAGIAIRYSQQIPIALTMCVTALTAALAFWRLPRDAFGFALGTAATLAVFDLFSSHAFFNQWWLVTCFVAVALACEPGSDMVELRGASGAKTCLG